MGTFCGLGNGGMPIKIVFVYIQLAWKFWLSEFHTRAVFVKQALSMRIHVTTDCFQLSM